MIKNLETTSEKIKPKIKIIAIGGKNDSIEFHAIGQIGNKNGKIEIATTQLTPSEALKKLKEKLPKSLLRLPGTDIYFYTDPYKFNRNYSHPQDKKFPFSFVRSDLKTGEIFFDIGSFKKVNGSDVQAKEIKLIEEEINWDEAEVIFCLDGIEGANWQEVIDQSKKQIPDINTGQFEKIRLIEEKITSTQNLFPDLELGLIGLRKKLEKFLKQQKSPCFPYNATSNSFE